jgi:conjugative transfer signal peptidase TraF
MMCSPLVSLKKSRLIAPVVYKRHRHIPVRSDHAEVTAVLGEHDIVYVGRRFRIEWNREPVARLPHRRVSAYALHSALLSDAARLSLERQYRSTYDGTCPDHGWPLMKVVVAREGDIVNCAAEGIRVNGKLLSNTRPLLQDSHGRPLRPWPYGRYIVQPGEVWVASTFNGASFDSRYFGPIPVSTIRLWLKPLLTWG